MADVNTSWCYIGSSIFRVIQRGKIWNGTKEEVLALPDVAYAVEKYPNVAKLIVSADQLTEARKKVSTEGTLYYRLNKRLLIDRGKT